MAEIKDLIDKYPHKKEQLLKLERKERIAEMRIELADNDAMKEIVTALSEMVDAINSKILYNIDISELERRTLFVERNCWQWFLNIFPQAKLTLKNIDKIKERYDKGRN